VRGKSNIVQVFDTQTENTLFARKYDASSAIKGLASIGSTVFDLKHVVVMQNGRVLVDQAQNEAKKVKSKPVAEWQLQMVPSSKVTCMA